MRIAAAILFLLLGIACIFGAAEAFQMSQELSLEALRLEWDLANFDWATYKSVTHKAEGAEKMLLVFIFGIFIFGGSGGGLLIKEP